MYLPLFPLKLVAFPGERLNLHIFEPRYKELIADVVELGGNFGVCTFSEKLTGFGSEVKLKQIFKRYEDGRLDIETLALRPFRIKSFDNPVMGKNYAGGEVEFWEENPVVTSALNQEFLFYLKEMRYLLAIPTEVEDREVNSFTYAHKVGLSLDDELELLKRPSEKARMTFLIRHFKRMIPAIKAIERAQEKIKLNGHFKYLDPLDF